MHTAAKALEWHRHAQDLRDTWQGRVLAEPPSRIASMMLSVIAHNYEGALMVLLAVIHPGFVGIRPPFYCSAGRILETGHVVADLVTRTGALVKRSIVFRNEAEMQGELRRLADKLKLNDDDREEMFAAARRWIVCDFRIDPLVDPRDPGAKRYLQ